MTGAIDEYIHMSETMGLRLWDKEVRISDLHASLWAYSKTFTELKLPGNPVEYQTLLTKIRQDAKEIDQLRVPFQGYLDAHVKDRQNATYYQKMSEARGRMGKSINEITGYLKFLKVLMK